MREENQKKNTTYRERNKPNTERTKKETKEQRYLCLHMKTKGITRRQRIGKRTTTLSRYECKSNHTREKVRRTKKETYPKKQPTQPTQVAQNTAPYSDAWDDEGKPS